LAALLFIFSRTSHNKKTIRVIVWRFTQQILNIKLLGEVTMVIDHIALSISDYEEGRMFFTKALAPLGITLVMETEGWAGFGKEGKPEFWFGGQAGKQTPMHIAFAADSREQVRAFYDAALGAGARSNGAPGIRETYHADYYGAFVIGPDGHNIEAVCHKAER
jgi:catechol 2,3-dioxygenase-like lactoylglutathione lyase family enzyme